MPSHQTTLEINGVEVEVTAHYDAHRESRGLRNSYGQQMEPDYDAFVEVYQVCGPDGELEVTEAQAAAIEAAIMEASE